MNRSPAGSSPSSHQQAVKLAAASLAASALKASIAASTTVPPATGAILEHELHRRSSLPIEETVSFLTAAFPAAEGIEEQLPLLFKRSFDPDVVSIFVKVAAARAGGEGGLPSGLASLQWSVALLGGISRVTGWSSCALMLSGKEKDAVRHVLTAAKDSNAAPAEKLATLTAAFRL